MYTLKIPCSDFKNVVENNLLTPKEIYDNFSIDVFNDSDMFKEWDIMEESSLTEQEAELALDVLKDKDGIYFDESLDLKDVIVNYTTIENTILIHTILTYMGLVLFNK
jgi:hypothetical protein